MQDAEVRSGGGYEVYDELIQRAQLTFRLNLDQYFLPESFRDGNGKIDYDQLFSQAEVLRQKYARNPLVRADAVKVYADGVTEANPNNVPPTLGNSPRPVPYLQPIFAKDAAGLLTVTGYVDVSSPVCVHVRVKPDDYSSPGAIANFMRLYGYHPGQRAISYGIPEHAPEIRRAASGRSRAMTPAIRSRSSAASEVQRTRVRDETAFRFAQRQRRGRANLPGRRRRFPFARLP